MTETDKNLFDVQKRQRALFEASVGNANIANSAIQAAQASTLALGLAEMAFLTSILIATDGNNPPLKGVLVLLVIAFVAFIVGSIWQYKYTLRKAREFESLANIANDNYLSKGIEVLNEEPDDLSLPKKQIKSNKWINLIFMFCYILILGVTMICIGIVLGW